MATTKQHPFYSHAPDPSFSLFQSSWQVQTFLAIPLKRCIQDSININLEFVVSTLLDDYQEQKCLVDIRSEVLLAPDILGVCSILWLGQWQFYSGFLSGSGLRIAISRDEVHSCSA